MVARARAQAGPASAGEWAEAIRRGEARSLARMLSLVETRAPFATEVLQQLYSHTGNAQTIGITGAAGSGKSSLIARMAEELRRREKKVGILTIDPTSPLTGGALLGDRVRMRELFLDPQVFIRSLASRGQAGGISGALHQSMQLLDAAGHDYILVETIGIGQDQVDITAVTDTVVLVITPESGDEVQAMKAGILELADFFVINKSDLPGAKALQENLSSVLDVGARLYLTSALRREGIDSLVDGLVRHREQLRANGREHERKLGGARAQLWAALRERVEEELKTKFAPRDLDEWVQKIADRRIDPNSAAKSLLAEFTTEIQSTQSRTNK